MPSVNLNSLVNNISRLGETIAKVEVFMIYVQTFFFSSYLYCHLLVKIRTLPFPYKKVLVTSQFLPKAFSTLECFEEIRVLGALYYSSMRQIIP